MLVIEVILGKVVLSDHKMLQNIDSDECAGPVPEQPKKVGDRVIEPVCAYDRY